MSGVIQNGQRLAVAFGSYEGEAGVRERPDGAREVAMFADLKQFRRVESGTVDGVGHLVISITASAFVKGMVVLVVSPAAETA